MDSFGIVDFALPFGAVALVLLCWMGVSRLSKRRERARGAGAADPARAGGAGAGPTGD